MGFLSCLVTAGISEESNPYVRLLLWIVESIPGGLGAQSLTMQKDEAGSSQNQGLLG